jgi:hypothetical protein
LSFHHYYIYLLDMCLGTLYVFIRYNVSLAAIYFVSFHLIIRKILCHQQSLNKSLLNNAYSEEDIQSYRLTRAVFPFIVYLHLVFYYSIILFWLNVLESI